MRKQEPYRNLLRFCFSVVVLGAMVSIWAYFWLEYYADIILRPFGYKGNWLIMAVYGILQVIFTNFYGGYRIGYYKREDVIYSGILALILCNAVTYLQTCLVGRGIMDARPFLGMTFLQAIVIFFWAMAAHACYLRVFPPRKMLMVYSGGELAASLLHKMMSYHEKYAVREVVNIAEGFEKVCDKVLKYESVILCDLPSMRRNRLLKLCFEKGIRTYTTPKLSDILIRGSTEINLFDTPLLLSRNYGLRIEQRFLKRLVDIVFSAIGLVIFAPFMLMAAAAIKLCDGGPVFFYQERCTIGNKKFRVCKFRSMIVDAEKDGKSQPAVDDDPRITPVGRVLRFTRMDELPQLWNILKGDMSIVGPRPERLEHVEKYTEEIPEFIYRSKVKAGLTGLAQIVGRYNTTAYDKLKLDLMYITNYSLFQDFKLMLMTVKILFMKSSTEGFQDKQKENVLCTAQKISGEGSTKEMHITSESQ